MRRLTIMAVLVVSLVTVGVGEVPAWAAAHFTGNAPGAVTCTVTATVKYSPPLTNTGGGTTRTVTGRLRKCTATTTGVFVSLAKFRAGAAFTNSVLDCNSPSSTSVSTELSLKWFGRFSGSISGLKYNGKASYLPSITYGSGEQLVTNSGHQGFTLPTNGPSSGVNGSFRSAAGGLSATVYSTYSATQLATMCSGSGIKKLPLTGTMTIG